MSPHLYSRSTPFFSSCLMGLFSSLVATSNLARVHLGISQQKFSGPSSPWQPSGMSCQGEMDLEL